MISRLCLIALFWVVVAASPARALFGTGTVMDKGRLQIGITVNPFEQITYGQNFAYFHYGLGNGWEAHSYLSKWGTISNWSNSTYEIYGGFVKEWFQRGPLEIAVPLGIRKVLNAQPASLVGPGILYTVRISPALRAGGHILFIGTFAPDGFRALNHGYTWEAALYGRLNSWIEVGLGIFANTEEIARPIYIVNFDF